MRSHARVIPGTSTDYVYDGYDLAMERTYMIELVHPLDSNLKCMSFDDDVTAGIEEKTNQKRHRHLILNGGLGYWINAIGKDQTPNVCVRWCYVDKEKISPMECIIVALCHISPHTQLLCDYNNNAQRQGFNIESDCEENLQTQCT